MLLPSHPRVHLDTEKTSRSYNIEILRQVGRIKLRRSAIVNVEVYEVSFVENKPLISLRGF